MKRHFFSKYLVSLVVAGFGLFLSDCLAAVTFSVTPLAVGNQYAGAITLQIGGLTNGETVVVQKFLDLNTNGMINASDWLVQQFNLTDGQAGMAIGGVTNFNVPGDTHTTAGQITAKVNFRNGDFMQSLAGKYLYKLSSPSGHFTPKTNLFSVTNFPYAQKFTGNVVSNATSTTLPNAIVILCPPPGPGDSGPSGPPLAGAVANNSGSYTIQAPPGAYSLVALKSNYVVNFSTPPVLTLSSGQTVTTNLTVANAASSISGKVVDANNASIGLPGILLSVQATNGLMGVGFTDTNGNFTVGVPSSPAQWWLGADISGLLVHGYLGLGDRTNANAGQTGVTLALPKATALFYGSVKDNLGNPLAGIEVYANDNNNDPYESDCYTDTNGNYVAGALAGDWRVEISSDTRPTNYLLSQPDFGSNGGTNISANTAVQINFTALLATHYISGSLKDNGGNPIVGVGVWAYATIDGVVYHQGSVDTDADGNYSLDVANGTWTVGVSSGGGDDSLPGNYLCPANQSVVIANNNATANFTALSATSHITGHVQQANDSPIGYVGVWANATINSVDYFQYVDADGNGNYSLNVANGSWTVGVNCGGSSDSLDAILGRSTYLYPGNQNVTINNNDGVANFTVQSLPSHITGYVRDDGNNPIAGVGVYAYSGNQYFNGGTDDSGYYQLNVADGCWNVRVGCSGGSGTLSQLGYLCVNEQSVCVTNGTATADFHAIRAPFRITGYLKDTSNNPIAHTSMYAASTLNGTGYTEYVDTDGNGYYSFNVANGNWNVGVNWASDPDFSAAYICLDQQTISISNSNGVANFTALAAPFQITGAVKDDSNNPVAGVGVSAIATINGAVYRTAPIDTTADGSYSLKVGNGQWTVSLSCCCNDNSLNNLGYQCVNDEIVDIAGANGTINFTVYSSPLPSLHVTTTYLPKGTNGAFYSQTLQASGGRPPYSWSIPNYSAGLPPNLTLATHGALSGTLTTAGGPFYFDAAVTDAAAKTAYQTLSLTIVNPPLPPLLITNVSLPSGTAGAVYSAQLGATGGQPPYSWSLTLGSASLPPDLALDSAGLISGTSATNKVSTFKVQVTDANFVTTNKVLSITINSKPVLGSPRWRTNQFQIQLTGASNQNYTVQMSTNLSSTNWISLFITNNTTTNSFLLTDPNATNKQGFYRVKVGP